MSVIWVVETVEPERESAANILLADFAVRRFSSIENFCDQVRVQKHSFPDLIVYDSSSSDWSLASIDKLICKYLPACVRVYIADENTGLSPVNMPQGSYFSAKPLNSFKFSRLLTELLDRYASCIQPAQGTIQYKDVYLDYEKFQYMISPSEDKKNLPLKEAQLLKIFLENPGKCLSREEIKSSVWLNITIGSRTVDSHISRLRKRLDPGEVFIDSVYGGGYVMR